MKIEKINENQIRCTLTREDLGAIRLISKSWLMVPKRQKTFPRYDAAGTDTVRF